MDEGENPERPRFLKIPSSAADRLPSPRQLSTADTAVPRIARTNNAQLL